MPYPGPQSGVDPTHIPHPDPTRHYRWIRDSREKLAGWTRSFGDVPGYRIERLPYAMPVEGTGKNAVKEEDTTWGLAKKLGLNPEAYVDVGRNRIRYHDVILASIPVAEAHRRIMELRRAESARANDVREGFMAQADALPGINPIEGDAREFEDRKRHAARQGRDRVVSLVFPRNKWRRI